MTTTFEKSTHKVEVVKIKLEPHPNADTLAIVRVFSGYTVVVKKTEWKDGDLAAYIPPDSLVDPTRPQFHFLDKNQEGQLERIKVRRLRGVYSQGLLIPAPEGAAEGDDVAEVLDVKHYEPEEEPAPARDTGITKINLAINPPPGFGDLPKYDVDSLRRYAGVFIPGELVAVTEKIHGVNARFVYVPGEGFFAGSRKLWVPRDIRNIWWRALVTTVGLTEWLVKNPLTVVYGEIYGTQDLSYGLEPGAIRLAVFDILSGRQWLNFDEARNAAPNLPWVPLLGVIEYDLETVLTMAEGISQMPFAKHPREGVVVKPVVERTHPKIGRVQLEVVGNDYLDR